MRRPKVIPPSVPREDLVDRPQQRTLYIHSFQLHNWYPNFCLQARIDLSATDSLRKELNAADNHPGHRITFNHVINKAVANALRNHILFNAKHTRRDSIIVYPRIHVANVVDVAGMASQVVVRDADTLTLRELAEQTHRLVSARRTTLEKRMGQFIRLRQSLRLADTISWALPYINRVRRDLSHERSVDYLENLPGTVVVTNPGTLGVQDCKAMMFFGHLMCCLRVMAIEEEAVVEDGQVRFRKVLPMGLDYDQRLCDAGPAARLLNEIRRNLERPRDYSLGPAVATASER